MTDVYSFILQNLNPLMTVESLIMKMIGYVKMLWQKCVPHELYRYIYLKDNNLIWAHLQITFQKTNVIFKDFVRHNSKHLNPLKKYLIENAKIYQHLHATLYPKFYPRIKIGCYLICYIGNGLIVRITNPQLRLRLLIASLPVLPPQLKEQESQKIQKITNDCLRQLMSLNKFC